MQKYPIAKRFATSGDLRSAVTARSGDLRRARSPTLGRGMPKSCQSRDYSASVVRPVSGALAQTASTTALMLERLRCSTPNLLELVLRYLHQFAVFQG
jgi:hypothetical protein